MITKAQATAAILEAKKAKGLSFEQLASEIGHDKVWTAAAVMGQASVPAEAASKLTAQQERIGRTAGSESKPWSRSGSCTKRGTPVARSVIAPVSSHHVR